MTEEKANLINEVIFLNDVADTFWDFHPENPNKVDVVVEYDRIKAQIQELENQIEQLG
jgi:hypothetical protein